MYPDINGESHELKVRNINPYLVNAQDILIYKRSKPICNTPEMIKGSSPTDGGNLLLEKEDLEKLLFSEPKTKKLTRRYLGSFEFINNVPRWCLWLKNVDPHELKRIPFIVQRINAVKEFRLKSNKEATRRWAAYPYLFIEERQPDNDYLIIPRVSSENRRYIPLGYLRKDVIISDSAIALPKATLYHFGVLTSIIHMAWVKYTCGRLKSDFRYSNTLVYNNFPWPENPSAKQKQAVEKAAQAVLDARANFPSSSLADLYDPNTMPSILVKAHQALDKAVDLCYRSQPFINETKRIEFLFELYAKYTAGLFVKEKKTKIKRAEK